MYSEGKMKKTVKNLIVLIALVAVVFICMVIADQIQKDFGNIIITEGTITVNDLGELKYKLYTPKGATAENKTPAVLLLHGYQNDHEYIKILSHLKILPNLALV